MGFGRFPPSSGQPFGRKAARDGEFADGRQLHGRDGAANAADRRSPSLGPKSAPGWHVHPRREDPAAASNTANEERAELDPGAAQPAEPHAAADPDSWSADEDARFAGRAAPSPLVAELAAGGAKAARPPAGGRGMDAALEQTLGGAVANAGDDQDGELPLDEIEDIAVTIGRVVGIHGSVLWGTLYDDEDNTAASAARMGALVSLRGPSRGCSEWSMRFAGSATAAAPRASALCSRSRPWAKSRPAGPMRRRAGFGAGCRATHRSARR